MSRRRWRMFLPMIVVALGIMLFASAPAQSGDSPRLGDSSAAFDAALGPAILGQSWWYYPLVDGSLARGASSASSLEIVPRVLFLQRNWNSGNCADFTATAAAVRQYLPGDARKQWGSEFGSGGGSLEGSRVEGWYSDSLAALLAGSGVREPGMVVITEEYGYGDNCIGTLRITFDAAKAE